MESNKEFYYGMLILAHAYQEDVNESRSNCFIYLEHSIILSKNVKSALLQYDERQICSRNPL